MKPLDLILIDVVDGLNPQASKIHTLMNQGGYVELSKCTQSEKLLIILFHLFQKWARLLAKIWYPYWIVYELFHFMILPNEGWYTVECKLRNLQRLMIGKELLPFVQNIDRFRWISFNCQEIDCLSFLNDLDYLWFLYLPILYSLIPFILSIDHALNWKFLVVKTQSSQLGFEGKIDSWTFTFYIFEQVTNNHWMLFNNAWKEIPIDSYW
jgi:hypothetical protein